MNACALVLSLGSLLPVADETVTQKSRADGKTLTAPASTLAALTHVVDGIIALRSADVESRIQEISAKPSETDLNVVEVTVDLVAHADTAQRAGEWLDDLSTEFEATLWRRFDARPVEYDLIKETFFFPPGDKLFHPSPPELADVRRSFVVEVSSKSTRSVRADAQAADTPDSFIRSTCWRDNINFGQVRIDAKAVERPGNIHRAYRVRPQQRETTFNLVQVLNLLYSLERDSPSMSLGAIHLSRAASAGQLNGEFELVAPKAPSAD